MSTSRWFITGLGHCWKVELHEGWDCVNYQVVLHRVGTLLEGRTSQRLEQCQLADGSSQGLGRSWQVGLHKGWDSVNWPVGLYSLQGWDIVGR
jgi:hypothetical protein